MGSQGIKETQKADHPDGGPPFALTTQFAAPVLDTPVRTVRIQPVWSKAGQIRCRAPRHSGIQIPKNQKPHPLKSGLNRGVTQLPL